MTEQTLVHGGEVNRWEQAIYAVLAEEGRRSDSGAIFPPWGPLTPPTQGSDPEMLVCPSDDLCRW
jgi:hypothetical protein